MTVNFSFGIELQIGGYCGLIRSIIPIHELRGIFREFAHYGRGHHIALDLRLGDTFGILSSKCTRADRFEFGFMFRSKECSCVSIVGTELSGQQSVYLFDGIDPRCV